MTHDARDDRMDEAIREAAQDYNRPPTVPREAMWARIEAARAASRTPLTPIRPSRSWVWSAAGAAAVLLLGVAIGYRMRGNQPPTAASSIVTGGRQPTTVAVQPSPATADSAPTRHDSTAPASEHVAVSAPRPRSDRGAVEPPASASSVDAASDVAYRLAVVEHLARTEALLTSFRAEAKSGTVDAQVGAWARDLLRTTRLMEASAETQDPTMRRLLGDLELVLVQIAQYSGAAGGTQKNQELDLIERSIERGGVITKLRAAIPPGMVPAGT